MKINPIQQQNYNNNSNIKFKGTIDKSVTNYLKTVRKDIIKTKRSDTELVKETSALINNIMTKLESFMAQTDNDTVLYLTSVTDRVSSEKIGRLKFKNRKTGFKIEATALGKDCGLTDQELYPIMIINPSPYNVFLHLLGIRGRHIDNSSLKKFNTWTNILTSEIDPASVDAKLADMENAVKELKDIKI